MGPHGDFDKKAQKHSLDSTLLYHINQGKISDGAAIDEQLATLGVMPQDLDYVLLTHLDCDHANGLPLVASAQQILVAKDELHCAKHSGLIGKVRFQPKWWSEVNLTTFDWNDTQGPFGKSYDLFGDGSVCMINIPGHTDGLCAVKITNAEGKYVLLFSDGGYSSKSWKEMILPGISMDKDKQRTSHQWIAEQSTSPNCLASWANHDDSRKPQVMEL